MAAITLAPPTDPVTAGFQAFTAFNEFLVTPAGQKFAEGANDLITGIFSLFHKHISNKMTAADSVVPKPISIEPVGGAAGVLK